jgi:outer membrane lipoprotein-sorting protein
MKPVDYFEKLIRDIHILNINTSAEMDRRILHDSLKIQQKFKQTKSAGTQPDMWRIIMKNPVTKSAVAAIIIIVVILGLVELIDTDSKSGVAWAEVVQKVQASRGVIFRSKDTMDWRDDAPDYTMNYLSGTHSRLDSYKRDQIIQTIYDDYNTKAVILVDYFHKSYVKMNFDEKIQQSKFLTNPKSMVQRFLSCEHREMESKTIEGVLCEGIETTDPAFDGSDLTDSLVARIWVSVETGYPVQLELEIVRKNGEIRIGGVSDQFQWDVELDESIFEPNIPTGYIDISP